MNQFLTADLHFNHTNIIKYCNRPFKDTKHMNDRLIANINARCSYDDILFHLGDFKFWKSSQATLEHKNPEDILNPKIVHIYGNHDRNNRVKGMLNYAVKTFNKTEYLLTHIPPTSDGFLKKRYNTMFMYSNIDCILCGHVHEAWQTRIYDYKIDNILIKQIPIINVGVDVWNFMPKTFDEIDVLYQRLKKEIQDG